MSCEMIHFMKKVLPVPEIKEQRGASNDVLLGECKVSSKQELEDTVNRMKMYNEAYRFDNYEPQLSKDELTLSDKMNDSRMAINAVIKNDVDARKYPPANPFYAVKQYIDDQSKLISGDYINLKDTFEKMPKGGNLHIHSSATYNMEKFLDDLDNAFPGEIFALENDYNTTSGSYLRGTLFRFNKATLKKSIPSVFVPLTSILGSAEAKRKLVQLYTLADNSDYYIDHIGYIWGGFNDIFSRVGMILNIREVFKLYYTEAFKLLIKDNLDYCELRCGIADTLYDDHNFVVNGEASPKSNMNEDDPEFIKILKDSYVKAASTAGEDGFQLKLILTANRGKEKIPSAIKKMELTKKWMDNKDINKNPLLLKGIADTDSSFIIGYDLVSEEDVGSTTKEFVDALYDAGKEALLNEVPMYLHDGESNRFDDDNLYTAYLVGTERIGHGLNLYRYKYLQDMVKQNQNTLEVCPISNQVLRYIADIRIHPIYGYLNSGLNCVICSDDPQIFCNDGLTYDFWEAYTGSDMDLRAVKKLIKNSYIYSGMSEAEKNIMLANWEKKWDLFIKDLIFTR